MNTCPYELLGVGPQASFAEIKAAHRRLIKQFHPDHFEGGTLHCQLINAAFDLLKDPMKRSAYDRTRQDGGASRKPPPPPPSTSEPPASTAPAPGFAFGSEAMRTAALWLFAMVAVSVAWMFQGYESRRTPTAKEAPRTEASTVVNSAPAAKPMQYAQPAESQREVDHAQRMENDIRAWDTIASAIFRKRTGADCAAVPLALRDCADLWPRHISLSATSMRQEAQLRDRERYGRQTESLAAFVWTTHELMLINRRYWPDANGAAPRYGSLAALHPYMRGRVAWVLGRYRFTPEMIRACETGGSHEFHQGDAILRCVNEPVAEARHPRFEFSRFNIHEY